MTRCLALALLLAACGGQDGPPLTAEELLDPAACADCHPDHYRQWQGSSHAFAADDPVFQAMNARFQRDTGGAYAADCVRCHAPVALAQGAVTDGRELPDLSPHLKGVTCYACHAVVEADPSQHVLRFGDDGVMGGSIASPVGTGAHASGYAALFDRAEWSSTDLCGACHDFENRAGAHAHRTLTEWTESLFADTFSRSFLTCSGCHMDGVDAPVAEGGPQRRLHDHRLPGVNVALVDWPERDDQREAIQGDLDPAIKARLCLTSDLRPEIMLDNVMAGHMWPSGDASTRRAWVELIVERDGAELYASGAVPDGTAVDTFAATDPDLWQLRDRLTNAGGDPVAFSWEAVAVDDALLPPAVTADPEDPRFFHAVTRLYPPLAEVPDRMTMRVRIRPIGLDLIDELIAGGDLAPAIRDAIPTFTLGGTELEWAGDPGSCEPGP